MSFTPLTSFVILFGAVLPPIRKVVEAGIEHGSWDIRGRWGIMEDAWLEAVEGVGASKGPQGVLFFPACVVIQLLEIGQVFGQVSNLIMGIAKVLYFSAEGLISLLLNGKIDHWHEGLSGEEGVRLLAGEDPLGVGIFPCSERVQVAGAVASLRKEEFGVVGEEVIPVEGGIHRSSSQSWDRVVMLWCHPLDVLVPVISGYNPEFFRDFGGGRAWSIVKVWGRRPWIWFVWCGCLWRLKEVELLDRYLWVSDDKQLVHVGCGRAAEGFTWVTERVEIGVVPKDLHNSMKDRPSWGLWGLVVLSCNEDVTADCSRRGVEDVRGGVPGLTVIAEHLYGDT
jgi:hypothetical protein